MVKKGRNYKFTHKCIEGFLLGLIRTQGHIKSSTKPLTVLKFLVTL
jgi:hypothetical protein